MKDNKGMSLVELLISIAIFSVVMIAVFSVLRISTKTYTKNNLEVNAQNEAQTLMNQLDSILVDSMDIVKSGSKYTITKYSSEESGEVKYELNVSDEKLYFSKIESETEGTGSEGTEVEGAASAAEYSLLAEDIEDFIISMSSLEDYGYVQVSFSVDKEGTKYRTSKNVFLRNYKTERSADVTLPADKPKETTSQSETTSSGSQPTTSSGGSSTTSKVTVKSIRVKNIKTDNCIEGKSVSQAIEVVYVMSDESEVACSRFSVSPSATLLAGNNKYTITSGTRSCEVDITAAENTATIEKLNVENTKIYYAGFNYTNDDAINLSDFKVYYTYNWPSQGVKKYLSSSEYSVTRNNGSFTFDDGNGRTASIQITILQPNTNNPLKVTFSGKPIVGNTISESDFVVSVNYLCYYPAVNTYKNITSSATITGIPSGPLEMKNYDVNFSAFGLSTTYTITVVPDGTPSRVYLSDAKKGTVVENASYVYIEFTKTGSRFYYGNSNTEKVVSGYSILMPASDIIGSDKILKISGENLKKILIYV